MTTIAKLKKDFPRDKWGWYGVRGGPDDPQEQALTNSVNAALLRGFVYSKRSPLEAREAFKEDWKNALRKAVGTRKKISEDLLLKNIEKIAAAMSRKHGRILVKKKMRVGTSQKALNLYLKYLWCLGKISEPPHCPLDARILAKARLYDAKWTHLDSIAKYKQWIKGCGKAVERTGAGSLAEWELRAWGE